MLPIACILIIPAKNSTVFNIALLFNYDFSCHLLKKKENILLLFKIYYFIQILHLKMSPLKVSHLVSTLLINSKADTSVFIAYKF